MVTSGSGPSCCQTGCAAAWPSWCPGAGTAFGILGEGFLTASCPGSLLLGTQHLCDGRAITLPMQEICTLRDPETRFVPLQALYLV